MNDTTIPPTEAVQTPKRVSVCKSTITASALAMTFSNGSALTINADELADAPVSNLLRDLALHGLASILRTSYGAVRDDAAKSFEAAKAKLGSILEFGLDGPETAPAVSSTMLDVAIEVLAELKNRTVAEIRAIVDAYADTTREDGTVFTADEKRKALVTTVKNDPKTAALFAVKRAAAKAPKRKEKPSILDSF